MAKIAVLGYGTVGSGVYEVIKTNQAIVNGNAGDDIEIKYVLDLRDFPGDPVEEILVHDYDVIVNDPEVSVVVEVMGGVEPAYTFVKNALLKGKSVCTSNKALVAAKGPELIRIAREKDINFFFEASVMTEAGLLPGGFIANQTPGYDHAEVAFEITDNATAMTNAYELGEQVRLVQKGAYLQYTASPTELQRLADQGNIIVRATDSQSGSDIAGISSADGRVLGLMANPEYAIEEGFGTDHPDGPGLGVDGQGLFISIVRAAGAVTSEGVRVGE